MRRLIYMSRSLIEADATTLDTLVREAAARNATSGVTGMLWFDGISFAQVLEGEHERVGETMRRISVDERHTDVEIFVDREVRGRAFGKWGMIQPDDEPESMTSTMFLVGLASAQRGDIARRFHDIIVACAG